MKYCFGIILITFFLNSCSSKVEDKSLVHGYLQTRASETDFSGAILIAKGGVEVVREAYGLADRELGIPMASDFVFRIGSLTKPFTASAVLLLVDKRLARLDDSFCGFIDNCPRAWEAVTLHHLLSHTSGIPDLFGAIEEAPVQETAREIDRVLKEHWATELSSAPGATYAYSNFNYMLLGYIIEKVTGQFWEDFLIDAFFEPLAMHNTRYDDVWAIVPGRARGYRLREERVANIEYDDHSAYAAGGLRSSLKELHVWHKAYVDDRIISSALRERATTPVKGNYGYGWQVLSLFGRSMYNHTGGIDGFSSHLAYYPEEELLIIVLSNSEKEDSKSMACDLAALVFKESPTPTGNKEWLHRSRSERCRQEQ